MSTIAKARAALAAAVDMQDPKAIKAARAALVAAEAGKLDTPYKKGKKAAAEAEEEPDGDEPTAAAESADPEEKADDANPDAGAEDGADGAEHEEPDGDEEPMAEGEAEGEAEAEDAEEAEAEEDKPKAKKKASQGKKAASATGSIGRLLAALGASNVAEAAGKAQALVEAAAALDAAKRQAKRVEKAAAMANAFDAARRDGRVTKAEVEHLRKVYATRPLGELKAYLAAKPRIASSQFATESNTHYPSEAVAGVDLASPFASKAMSTFGVTADAIAARAAARGIATNYPGAR